MARTFTVQFTVDQIWIDDGFDLTDEKAMDMLTSVLPFADPSTELLLAKVTAKKDDKF